MITRLHGRDRFRQLHRQGTRVRAGSLWCLMLPDPLNSDTEVAYAIGRTTGSAVTRNRVRRRLRALLAERQDHLPTGLMLVGVVSGQGRVVAAASYVELGRSVDHLVRQLNAPRGHHPTASAHLSGTD